MMDDEHGNAIAFARLLLFEGEPSDNVHFADQRVRLHNTLDYPSFSMATKKARTAFRLVGFRTVWYDQTDEKPKLHARFRDYENWPLHGLFWLSKDLFDDNFQRVTNPDAQAIFIIRNHLEHKYLQVHESWASAAIIDPITGSLGHSISRYNFAWKAVRLLKIARAAMIYLPLAVHMGKRDGETQSQNWLLRCR